MTRSTAIRPAALALLCTALAAHAAQAAHAAHAAPESVALAPPLLPDGSIEIPDVPTGPYSDHLAVDLVGKRLFTTPQAAKAVAVIDLAAGKLTKMITGIGNPHGLVYGPDVKRLFVADGASGALMVFSGDELKLIKSIPLTPGADALDYDPSTKLIYVNNGGEDAGMDQGIVSVIDTARMEKVTDIRMPTPRLEGILVDPREQTLYVEGEDELFAVDLRSHAIKSLWKATEKHRLKALALDESTHRLLLICRDTGMRGSLIVLDPSGGRVVTTLPIGGWADGVGIDKKRHRIYISSGLGYIESFGLGAHDVYRRLPKVESDLLAKTSVYSDELDRLYVSLPHLGDYGSAGVLIFKPTP